MPVQRHRCSTQLTSCLADSAGLQFERASMFCERLPLKLASCAFQEQRSQCLWKALEKIIPDIRERADLTLIGTPLTHERYLNRHRGTYGAAISAAEGSFPGPATDIPGLFRSATKESIVSTSLLSNLTAKAREGFRKTDSLQEVFWCCSDWKGSMIFVCHDVSCYSGDGSMYVHTPTGR